MTGIANITNCIFESCNLVNCIVDGSNEIIDCNNEQREIIETDTERIYKLYDKDTQEIINEAHEPLEES